MLLLAGALLAELTHDLFAQAGGLGHHIVQPIEHLPEVFLVEWGAVRHFGPSRLRINTFWVKLSRLARPDKLISS